MTETTHELMLPLFQDKPQKKYRTLMADPPWRIEMGPLLKKSGIRPSLPYPTMTQEELLMLPIGMWASERSHLYLWTTNSMLPQAYELAWAWGFKPSTLITWIKRGANGDGWMGLGRYYRSTTEHIVFAVRGGLDVLNNDQPNFFFAPHRGHSEKPDVFYDIVERMSPGPRLDKFSRKQRFGWDTWGNEAFDFQTHGIWNNEKP